VCEVVPNLNQILYFEVILVLSRGEVGTSYEQLVHSKINKFPKG
jgi:hypothetical protein